MLLNNLHIHVISRSNTNKIVIPRGSSPVSIFFSTNKHRFSIRVVWFCVTVKQQTIEILSIRESVYREAFSAHYLHLHDVQVHVDNTIQTINV